MRCSTLEGTDLGVCRGTATHLLLYSTPGMHGQPGDREHHRDVVCEPCGTGYTRRPALRARMVPLHIHHPTPAFTGIIEGHRLVDGPEHGTRCHDCGRVGSPTEFKMSLLHGCPSRPESVDHVALTGDAVRLDANGRARGSARVWFQEAAHFLGMGITDWHPVLNHPVTCAHFMFGDREYRVKYDLAGYRVVAEKLENRGRPAPVTINPEYIDSYRQVVFHFHHLVNRYESTYFATYTPGRKDVILHAPEGAISAVLRITGLNSPESTHLAQVTDAVCDAFGAVADLTFQTRIFE